ncbi:MAG: bifunctional DNA-formamidopyrimidine glycosylase/DNA-(apurinic or apyrimidinic site) lyase, partial [Actinomycetota bacterium]|nr:bifunctional DNA-formamidopyrimidine glycosylase/DNA-(apurinic or apyrimidinic site) lyase [Actinomycetota bacterium]
MPELPEVETIRRDLDREFTGERINEVSVTGVRSIRRHEVADDFTRRLVGSKVDAVGRRGKYLTMKLDTGDVLIVHLGMSGQLLRCRAADPLDRHTHVVLDFEPGAQLRFVDPRTFGELFVTAPDDIEEMVPELAHLGPDPLELPIAWPRFADMLHVRKSKLKPLLMDQRFLAGIGNMYADEILFAAGLRYDRSSETLTAQEVRRLYRSMIEVLTDAIKHRGSSLADEQYRDLFGQVGDFQSQHQVYDREGKACRRCRSVIVRIKANG